ncbi:MAG: hypothetical protein AOA66_0476 [Candidatus Bathyarchaeota archaeon BA2]|nr:MAG: hypothetical protein AOA66_0476 [Candidatus Bathyarchaeota archaeon BA2]
MHDEEEVVSGMEETAAQFKEIVRQKGFRNLAEEWQGFSSKLSASERQQIVIDLSKDNPWTWEPVLDNFLSTEDVELCLPILSNIAERTGLGIRLLSFRERCSEDVKFAGECMSHLNKIGSENSLGLSSIVLAYSLSKNENRWRILKDKVTNASPAIRYNSLLASRILINMKILPGLEFLKTVHELGTKEMETRVNEELAWISILTYDLMPDAARNTLVRLLRSRNLAVAYEMLKALSYKNNVPTALRFKFLRTLSEVKDPNIEEQIAWCIATFGHTDLPTSMDILRKIAARNHYSISGGRSWAFQQLGKKREQCLQVIKSWASEKLDNIERYKLHRFFLPEVLMELTIGDRDALVGAIEDLSASESNDNLVIATIQEYVRDVPTERWVPKDPNDEKRLDRCVAILKKIAIRSGKPSEKFPRVKEKLFQCGQIIELIQSIEHKPQPKLVKEGLELFTNLKRFISVSVDEEQVREPPPLPLFFLLGSDRCTYKEYVERLDAARKEEDRNRQIVLTYRARDALARFGILTHLDNCLARIEETETGTKELRAKLLHEKEAQFQSAVSEIEVIGRLRPHLPLTISEVAPTTGGAETPKRPDIGIEVLGSPIHIEVITPGMAAVLRYLGGGSIPNRLVGMILSEFNKHLKGLADDREALIVVDVSHSEIDYLSADSAMSGSLALSMIWDTEKGQAVAEYPTRGKDAISIIEPATRKILGLIVYKKTLTKEGCVILRGKFIPNPLSAKSKKILACKIIRDTFLDLVD